MQMYVLAALLGATSAIKNNMPTAVAAPAAASGATAVAAPATAPGVPPGTKLCDTPPTDQDQKHKDTLKCKYGYIWVTNSLTTKTCSFHCYDYVPPTRA